MSQPVQPLEGLPPSRFQDLANLTFFPEDWIVIDDQARGRRYTLEIIEPVARRPDEGEFLTVYKVRVVESTSKELKLNAILPRFTIDRSKQVWGAVIRKNDRSRHMDQFQRDEFTVIELRKFLDRQDADNYRARFKTAVDYLLRMNILPAADGDFPKSANYKYLQRLCRQFKSLVWSKGGYVGSTGTDFQSALHEYENASGAPRLIEVDMKRLTVGLSFIFSAFSCFRVKNGEDS